MEEESEAHLAVGAGAGVTVAVVLGHGGCFGYLCDDGRVKREEI